MNLETGAVWQNRNDVRILPNTGSYVEFDQFDQGPFLHYRFEAEYSWKKSRHGFRLLVAPFSVSVSGSTGENIQFNGETFNGGQNTDIDYTFNSYRLTYRYGLFLGKAHQFYVGLTAKVRQAEIVFTQGNTITTFDNVGFVPLFYFKYIGELSENWLLYSDLDIAAASQGRAIDFSLKLRRKLCDQMQLGFGARTLEGGADNDTVFTFSWFNYAVVDLNYTF